VAHKELEAQETPSSSVGRLASGLGSWVSRQAAAPAAGSVETATCLRRTRGRDPFGARKQPRLTVLTIDTAQFDGIGGTSSPT
jgi:hypothetical protein